MPVNHSFDGRIALLEPVGDYSTAELKQALLVALADPECPPNPSLLLDLGDSRVLLGRTSSEIIDVAEFLVSQRARLGARQAIVVTSTAAFGLVRMGAAHAMTDGQEPRVFRDRSEARVWLVSSADGDD